MRRGRPGCGSGGCAHPPRLGAITLVDDLARGKVAWRLARPVGVCKTKDAVEGEFFGGSAGVVVVDDVAFTSFIRPTGDAVNEKTENRYYKLGRTPSSVSLIDADDVTVAVDLETGKELWVAEERGASMNFLFSKRGHFGVTPAAGGGMVYTWGGLGKIYAYDARTGQKRWETDAGGFYRRASDAKTRAVADRAILGIHGNAALFQYLRTGLVLADGVLVAPDGFEGLIGFDAATGEERWRRAAVIAKAATPVPWRNGGKTFLLCPRGAPVDGTYTLLDAERGTVLWAHKIEGPAHCSVVIEGDIAILNTKGFGQGSKGPPTRREQAGLFGGFELSRTGARQLWVMEDKPEFWFEVKPDIGRIPRTAARDGVGYLVVGNMEPIHGQTERRNFLVAVDVRNGQVLAQGREPMPVFAGAPHVLGDRVIVQGDVGHSWDGVHLFQYQHRAGSLDALGVAFHPAAAGVLFVTDYEVPLECAWWKGRMIGKARDGLVCIDFRK